MKEKIPEFTKAERVALKIHVIDNTLFSREFRDSLMNAIAYIQHLEDEVASYKRSMANINDAITEVGYYKP